MTHMNSLGLSPIYFPVICHTRLHTNRKKNHITVETMVDTWEDYIGTGLLWTFSSVWPTWSDKRPSYENTFKHRRKRKNLRFSNVKETLMNETYVMPQFFGQISGNKCLLYIYTLSSDTCALTVECCHLNLNSHIPLINRGNYSQFFTGMSYFFTKGMATVDWISLGHGHIWLGEPWAWSRLIGSALKNMVTFDWIS